jgi:hypothetical protein
MNTRYFAPLLMLLIGAAPATQPAHQSFLDDGIIRVGVNLDAGGAITYLSAAGEDAENLVNNWDWGRQIQMSHYSGPVPFTPAGKQPATVWAGLGWNPVQAGDAFKNKSKVIEHHNDGKTITLTCIPMQWPLDNVPSECLFETRTTLEKNAVHVSCRLTNQRSDHTQYSAHGQELPAIYTIGKLYRLFSYSGDKPFTGEAIERIEKRNPPPGTTMPNWGHWQATENWAALVNERDWGVGVWNPATFEFSGGFYGKEGVGGTHDDPTGYIAPAGPQILDHNIVYDYSYVLIVGSLDDIRTYAAEHGKPKGLPAWRFQSDRQGWYYVNASDTGWPIQRELDVRLGGDDPQLIGPMNFWRASDGPHLRIEAAFKTQASPAVVYFRAFGDAGFSAEKFVSFPVRSDGAYHVYDVDLSRSAAYRGAITQLRLDPTATAKAGDWVKIRSIELRGAK